MLDSGRITEHDGEMFCGACYRKNFGPKGYGFGGGAGTLGMDDGNGYKSQTNKVDHAAQAYVAPRKTLVESNGQHADINAGKLNLSTIKLNILRIIEISVEAAVRLV